jgi:1-acyl-sn-glycerol-3-phosphate acyltransferase
VFSSIRDAGRIIQTMLVKLAKWLFHLAFVLLTRVEEKNLENLPAKGPYILAANHLSRADPPLLFTYFGGENVTGWVANKYRRNLFFGLLVRLGNPIFIRRGEIDRHAIEAAVEALRDGKIFGLAPEGTRSRVGSLLRGKTGIAYLADAAQVPILPVAITGTDTVFRDLLHLRRPEITITFGELFSLPPLDPEDRNAGLRQNADEVMCRIAAMLPESYRGVYADHPRLKEFLTPQT